MLDYEVTAGDFLITCDPAKLDKAAVHRFLASTYWAPDIPRETVETSLQNSLCFSVLYLPKSEGNNENENSKSEPQQVGLARVVSDFATFAYLCDVYILEAYRGRGLSRQLMQAILAHPNLQGLRRFMLATRDAHGVYQAHGFKELSKPESFLEIYHPDIYQQ